MRLGNLRKIARSRSETVPNGNARFGEVKCAGMGGKEWNKECFVLWFFFLC